MNRKSSIVRKLIFYFLILNILTVISVGSYSYYRAKDALVKRTFDQLTSLRIEKKNRIERFFENRILDLNLVSKTDDVRHILTLIEKQDRQLDVTENKVQVEYKKFLEKHFVAGNYYNLFFVATPSGKHRVFPISSEKKHEALTNNSVHDGMIVMIKKVNESKEVLIEDFIQEEPMNNSAIFIGAPVYDTAGSYTGAVVLELNIQVINSIMYENNPHNGLGNSGESYLVGNDLLMRSTSRFQQNSVFKTRVNTEGVKKALTGNTGTEKFTDYRGVQVLSSYSNVNLPGLEWAILTEIDEQEAMIPIMSIRNNILYISVLITLLLFVLVYLAARRISQPIIRLKHAAEKITSGNYDVTVERLDSNDEVDNLVDAFNEMSKKIKEQTENLKLERSMRLSSMLDGQEMERQRLSRELHDGLGQSILAIRMRLERLEKAKPERAQEIMGEVQELIADTIKEVRSISNNLMPAVLKDFGLADALKNLCDELNAVADNDITFNPDLERNKISDKVSTYLYRMAQEALNNIIKHSGAARATLTLDSDADHIRMIISDDGKGFQYFEGMRLCGNGISNIKERVHLIGGQVEISSKQDSGTTIRILIPE
jgi:signal transduction histidine kinase